MAPADGDGDDRVRQEAIAGFGNRLFHQPVTGKAPTVPCEGRSEIGNNFGIARRRHPSVADLLEIPGELIETVRVMAEQIALDHDLGHRPRPIARHSGFFEERR